MVVGGEPPNIFIENSAAVYRDLTAMGLGRPLTEAFTGKSAQIRVPSSVTCEVCNGSGSKAGSAPKTCGTCNGQGAVRSQSGFFTVERTCPTCQGRGQVISDPCGNCGGQGRVTKERTLSVNIPAGVEDGTRIRLANEGEAGLRDRKSVV